MRMILAGGGTAGHINPALAIANFAKEKDENSQILYIGAKGRMEEKLVPQAGVDFKAIEISGFKRSFSLSSLRHNIRTVYLALNSQRECKKIISQFKPDICIGTGGYVSGPVIKTAQRLNIPTLILEQNAYPGITTKMLAKNANYVMLATEDTKKYIDKSCNVKLTGNPIRSDILKISKEEARRRLNLDERPLILSFGGSLGARKINEAVIELISWSYKENKYQHIHAYGKYGKWMQDKLKDKGVLLKDSVDLREYIDDMPLCLAAADLVICRAGAITLSELQAAAKAAILIPSPNVAENHQYHNAMALVKRDAASILEEKDLNGSSLIKLLENIMQDSQKLKKYEDNIKKLARTDANEEIYKLIIEVCKS